MNEESPFIIALTDAIERKLPEEIEDSHIRSYIKTAISDCISSDTSIIKKSMSTAYYRKVIKQIVREIKISISDEEHEFGYPKGLEVIQHIFNKEDVRIDPIKLYSIKIIDEELDIF